MKKTILAVAFFLGISTLGMLISPALSLAQKTEYLSWTSMPDEKIENLVKKALKKKIDKFYKEFSYIPYLHYTTADLNGDGKPEIFARFTEEYAFRDDKNNVDTHIFAYTKKGLIQILTVQAFDIAIGKKDKTGLREIIAFKNAKKSRYDIFKWDGKRRYVQK